MVEITRCSVTVRSDGTLLYEAGVEDPESQEGSVEWYINGDLAARDGPLFMGNFESNFQQPRDTGFTENEFLKYDTVESVRAAFGSGDFDVTVDVVIV